MFHGDLGLIPASKFLKRPQSGAAISDSGVLVCIMAQPQAFFGHGMSGRTGPKEHSF